jgi:hypothetical protein
MSDSEGGMSRRNVMKATGAGAMAAMGMAATAQTAAANCPCTGRELGKIESINGRGIQSLEVGTTYETTLTLDADQRIADDAQCQGDVEVTVQVTPTDTNRSGEVTCVDLKIDDDNGVCGCGDDGLYFSGATVKGGPNTLTYGCGDTVDENQNFSSIPDACAPTNDNNGQRYAISNIVIEACVFNAGFSSGDSCVDGGGS